MPITRRATLALGALPFAAQPFTAGAQTAEYPNRAVRVLVGFPPGGGVDIVARLLMPKLQERLGQPFLVENRAGANGNIAMDAAVKSPADGYTLFYGNVGNLGVTNALYRDLPFDTLRDFVPVAQTMESSLVIAVADALPVRSLAELIAYAKANPGKLNAGSAGAGGPSHLALELFKRQAGLDIVHVPYRGSAPAVQDLAGGRIQLLLDGYSLMRGAVESGKARVLAVAATERQAILPDIPTTTEAGMPGFEAGSWHALVAPAGTPAPVLRRLEAAVAWALRETDLPQAFAQQGVVARFRNADETRSFIGAERERWGKVVREAGIIAD
jgi:tripartite-type tricarboxylate transporter receptor subunit TctC